MRKSNKKILEEQLDNRNKIEALKKVRDDAEQAINNLLYEMNTLPPRDTTVNNNRMDDHLRGGGSMGAL